MKLESVQYRDFKLEIKQKTPSVNGSFMEDDFLIEQQTVAQLEN